jgi:phosphatidylglycerophosphatase A
VIVLRPTPAFAYSHPAHIVAFGFGAGLARVAPGTFGTLAAWLPGWLLAGAHPAVIFPLVAALFPPRRLGLRRDRAPPRGARPRRDGLGRDRRVSPRGGAAPARLQWQVAGFVLFRGFDIGKPPPIRWIERRWQGGFG